MKKLIDCTSTRRFAVTFLPLIFLSTSLALSLTPGPSARAVADNSECPEPCQEELSAAREATAQYHKESNALEDGFLPDPVCVQEPGLGGMGIHYENPGRMGDILVDPVRPELLLYEPQPNGKKRLVALEYYAPVLSNGQPWFGGPNDPPPVIDNPAPMLFGHTFDGPMPGHHPQMPWHYDLHVWAWRHNPVGLFTPFNPKVRCP
jgi:hypothetical protein